MPLDAFDPKSYNTVNRNSPTQAVAAPAQPGKSPRIKAFVTTPPQNTLGQAPNNDPYGLTPAERDNISKNQQYLTQQEQHQFFQAALQRKLVQRRQAVLETQLANVQKLAGAGEQGAKAAQQFLRQQGVNVGVDGNFGPQSLQALQQYGNQKRQELQGHLAMASKGMDFGTIRSQSNVQNTQLANGPNGARQFVQSQANSNIVNLDRQVAALLAGVNPNDAKAVNKLFSSGRAQNFVPPVQPDQTGAYDIGWVKSLQQKGIIDQKLVDQIKEMSDQRSQWTNINAASRDPKALDNTSAVMLRNRIIDFQKAQLQAENNAPLHPGGLWNTVKYWGGEALQTTAGKAVGWALKEINDDFLSKPVAIYSAIMREREKGGNPFQALAAGVISGTTIPHTHTSFLPGPGGGLMLSQGHSDAARSAQETQTYEQRQKLVEAGDLLSVGQLLTGRASGKFLEQHPGFVSGWSQLTGGHQNVNIGTGKHDFVSGLADILTLPAKDPTIIFGSYLHGGAEFTELAARAASAGVTEDAVRAAGIVALREEAAQAGDAALKRFATQPISDQAIMNAGRTAIEQQGRRLAMDMSVNGRLMSNAIMEAVAERSGTAQQLAKALPGLDSEIAQAAIDARAAFDGATHAQNLAAEAVIHDAIATGKYVPRISVSRQFLNLAAERLPGVEGSVGRKALQLTDRLDWLRSAAAARGISASVFETGAGNQLLGALESAGRLAKTTAKGMWHDHVATAVEGMDLSERYWRLAQYVNDHAAENPLFRAAYDGIMRPYFDNPQASLFMREAHALGHRPDFGA
jgi:hypothetical protein